MKVTNRIVVGVIAGLICLPLISALAGAANVEATWRSSEDGFVNFAAYGYGGPRADAHVKVPGTAYVGDNVYSLTGVGQTVRSTVGRGGTTSFTVRIQNDGSTARRMELSGPGSSSTFKITYFAGTTDITNGVVCCPRPTPNPYRTVSLAPGAQVTVRVVIKAKAAATAGARVSAIVTAWPMLIDGEFPTPTTVDAVKVKVTRT